MEGAMTLDFINVGYGDAILIRSGSFTMLVAVSYTHLLSVLISVYLHVFGE